MNQKKTPNWKAKQTAWAGSWALYSLAQVVGLRDRFRFKWNFDEVADADLPELWIYHRKEGDQKDWHKFDSDYVVGLAEGQWYVYGFFATYSNSEGPGCDEVHLGDFESLEEAFFGILGHLAKNSLDGINEARWERRENSWQENFGALKVE